MGQELRGPSRNPDVGQTGRMGPQRVQPALPILLFGIKLAFLQGHVWEKQLTNWKSRLLMNHAWSSSPISVQKCPADDRGLALGLGHVGDPRPRVPRTGRKVSEVGGELMGSHILRPECQMHRPGCQPSSAAASLGSTWLRQGLREPGRGGPTATTAASVAGHRRAQIPKDTASSGRAASPGQEPGLLSPTGR